MNINKSKTAFDIAYQIEHQMIEGESKWVPIEEVQQLEVTVKGLDDLKRALIAYNNILDAKIEKAHKILFDEESSMNNESDELDFRVKQLERLRNILK